MKRNCPSVSSISLRKPLRQMRGATSGRIPSTTSTSASEASSESATSSILVSVGPARAPLFGGQLATAGLILQVAEEFRARIEHHDVALVAERRLVGLEAAIERVELGIRAVRGRVNRRRLRVPLALQLLRFAIRFGEGDLPLPVGVGADALGFGLAERAELVRHTSAPSTPIALASESAFCRVTAMILSRSVEIASCTVRLLNSSARLPRTVCEMRWRARSSSPPTLT